MEFKRISELRKEFYDEQGIADPGRTNPNSVTIQTQAQAQAYKNRANERIAMMEGTAKKYGEITDPMWAQYSYEEILQMEENGVEIPKEVLELAHAAQDTDATTYQIELNEAEQEQAIQDGNEVQNTDDTATKKASFFELVAKASAKIDVCEEKKEQINQAIGELTPIADEASSAKETFLNRQKNGLEKLKEIAEEWQTLKNKVDKGDKLTTAEANRYEELSQLFEEQTQENKSLLNNSADDIDEITKSLKEIDALSQKGATIGFETKDLGNQLVDFTGSNTYKATSNIVTQEIGIIGMMIAMALGKKTAQEAVKVGTQTEQFSNDTLITLNEIATILDIQQPLSIAKSSEEENTDSTEDTSLEVQNQQIQNGQEQENNKQKSEQTDIQKANRSLDKANSATTEALSVPSDGTVSGSKGTAAPTKGEGEVITTASQTDNKKKNSNDDEEETININKGNAKDAAKDGQKEVDNIDEETKEGNKETKDVIKDEQKTEKELEKEEKALQKKIKKQVKQMLQIQKETTKIEQKQTEMIAQYDTINAENDTLIEEAKSAQQQQQNQQMPGAVQEDQTTAPSTAVGATASFGTPAGGITEKIEKIEENSLNLNNIGTQFNINNRKVDKNRTTVTKLNKDIKTTDKKFQKTTKLKEKKSNERLQAEQEKQTKLQKQVSIVGVLESVFNLTTSIGTVMMAIPWTAAAGAILVNIGLKGTLACGLTKATIYAAHGDIKSAFITLGTTIMTATTAAMGAGGAAKSALGTATASLNVINSAAKVGASVRQVQGKDAGMLLSSISAITGAAAAVTGGIQNFSEVGNTAGTLAKTAKIAGASGTLLGASSEMISTGREWAGKDGDTALTQILNYVGMGMSTVGAIASIGDKISNKKAAKADNKTEKTETENKQDNAENNTQENTKELNEIKNAQNENTNSTDNKNAPETIAEKTPQAEVEIANSEQNTQATTNEVEEIKANAATETNQGPSQDVKDPSRDIIKAAAEANKAEVLPETSTQDTSAAQEAPTGEVKDPSRDIIRNTAEANKNEALTNTDSLDKAIADATSNNKSNTWDTIEKVAQGIGAGMNVASQFLQNNNTEQQQAQSATNNVKKHNYELTRKIINKVETQRIGFNNYYSRSNSGGDSNRKKKRGY